MQLRSHPDLLEVEPMRAVDCPCGEHFEGTTDTQLMEQMKQHADEDHGDEYTEADLRLIVNRAAYDAVPA
jgi:hypothetical protein